MEALPKLPMLLFEQKSVHSTADFAAVLKKKIRECYEEDPLSYSKEIKELENLRNKTVKVSRDVNGCSLLKRYYCQLCMLQNRFKGLKESELEFSWFDIYKGSVINGNIELELDAIMYNIGALHGELGAIDVRSRAESMKVACTHFQCAAWAFEQLRDNTKSHRSKDMSRDVVSFIYQIMLAQAQECILEKSILDNRKASIIAKVAAQVIEYYNSALLVLLQAAASGESENLVDIVGSRLYKEWKKFIEFKISYYSAICSLYMGNFCEEQQKMGERVAWYTSAEEKLNDALKQSKSIDRSEIDEAIRFLSDVITGKLNTAKKENDFVYHESVPTSDKLTAVKGASLVKSIGFSVSDKEVSGNDIFARLVPMEAHELASVYSEKKDNIVRDITTKIQDKDQDLATYMSSLQLDRDNVRPSSSSVPDELIEICAAMSVNHNALSDTKKSLKELEDLCEEVDKSIKEARKLIVTEERKEKEHQEKFGKRAPSMIIMELSKELSKHEETHERALQSHENLAKLLEQHANDIQLLVTCSAKDLESLLPAVSNVPVDEKNLQEMNKLLAKVDEMKEQRLSLESQLRDCIQKDDIMKKILSHPQNEIKDIFDTELKKYDNYVNLLNQNMNAQENILNALTKENAKYVATRKALMEHQQLRQNRIEQLINSYEVFHQVISSTQKGHEFYKKFHNIIARLVARVRSVTRVQEEERMQFVQVQAKKDRPFLPHSSIQPIVAASGAPKLKDYLPFVNTNKAQIPSQVPANQPVASMYENNAYPISYENKPVVSSESNYVSNVYTAPNCAPATMQPLNSRHQQPYSYNYYSQLPPAPAPAAEVASVPSTYGYQSSQTGVYQGYNQGVVQNDQYASTQQPYGYNCNSYNQESITSHHTNQLQIADTRNNFYTQHDTGTFASPVSNTSYSDQPYYVMPATSYGTQMYTEVQNSNASNVSPIVYQTSLPGPVAYTPSYSVGYDVTSNVPRTSTTEAKSSVNGNNYTTYQNGGSHQENKSTGAPPNNVPVDLKTTPDPNNLLSQFDPLWS